MREWFHWNFQSLISPLLLTVFIRSLRQWIEDSILHLSGCNNFFENASGMREWRHWNFQSLISPLLKAIFMRSLCQSVEDLILHISRINNFSKVLPVCANGVIKNRVLTRVLKWWVPGLITFENGESHQILVSPNPKMMSPDFSYNKPLSESLIFHKSLVYSLLILHAVSFKCIYKLK